MTKHERINTIPMKKLLLTICGCIVYSMLSATTFTVINTNASGAGSFLEAIDNANLTAGADNIEFNIPGMPPHPIPLTILNTVQITEALIIDGTTQPDNGYTGNCPKIIIDASTADTNLNEMISINAIDVSVYGLAFKNYTRLYSSFLSINADRANIGTAGKKNMFNNVYNSINIYADNVSISSNYFGCNCDGDAPDPNLGTAIFSTNVMNDIHVSNNLISGNENGMILGSNIGNSSNFTIQGNFVGTNLSGTAAIPNERTGIELRRVESLQLGGSGAGEGNLVSGNGRQGCLLKACSGFVHGNKVGTDITGHDTIPNDPTNAQYSTAFNNNGISGVTCTLMVGGFAAGEENVFFGNNIAVNISDSSGLYSIINNVIGQTLSGLVSPTQNLGVQLYYDTNNVIIRSNYLYGTSAGFYATQSRGFTVTDNIIGVDVSSNPLMMEDGIQFATASDYTVLSNQIQNCNSGITIRDGNNGYLGFNQIHDCEYPIHAATISTTCHYNQFDKNIISNNLYTVKLNNGSVAAANDDILPPLILGSTADSTWGTAEPDAWVDLALDITLDPVYPQGYSYPIPTITADATGHWVLLGPLSNPNHYTAMQTDLNNNSSGFSQRLNLGIAEQSESEFLLYPMPARDYLYIRSLKKNLISQWEILNSLGEIIKQGTSSGAASEKIDIKDLDQGYYFVRVNQGEHGSIHKCIIYN